MSINHTRLMAEATTTFSRIFMKYDALQKRPLEVTSGTLLPASQIHMIDAVGSGHGQTVTTLAAHFAISKSAVSQIVTKLVHDGYLLKTKRKGNEKEILLRLTPKGRRAHQKHARALAKAMTGVIDLGKQYSEPEIRGFMSILADIDRWFGTFSLTEK